ncbi:hypothetical protein Rsub_08263 [Raphidocelis subcapitata]|uniref:Uncharacterized protein n=1 Tax=Raphidocelis subcapitata TaxID=307507 RepID=A0A2V0PF56_9CHLO|nr:hypothetical protein Rsub_08263 [Raphidocelis subcapitata]|eukprot:GBF95827.1 hypothetical protein Rsub_08263 [Raphidocelis subcapitata]
MAAASFLSAAVAVADSVLLKTHARGPGQLRARREARVGPGAGGSGEVELHALDTQQMRRITCAAWRFDGLLDADALERALERSVAEHPPLAGWLYRRRRDGRLMLRWDPARRARGAVWVRAAAAGAPPANLHDGLALQSARLLPPLRRHALLAVQVTHFPDAGATLVVVSSDHTACDMHGLMRHFLAMLDRLCSEEAAGGARARAAAAAGAPAAAAAAKPGPVWDRSLLLAPPAHGWGAWRGSSCTLSSLGGGDECGLSASESTDDLASPSSAGTDAASASAARSSSGGGLRGAFPSGSSISSLASTSGGGGGAAGARPRRGGLRRVPSDASFWDGPERLWGAPDPFSRLSSIAMLSKLFFSLPASRSQTWLLPRSVVNDLKARLGSDLPRGAAPTANDVVSALLLATVAAVEPERVAARGGMNLQLIVNARGRFGLDVGPEFFGNLSVMLPVWIPADLLLPAPASDCCAPASDCRAPAPDCAALPALSPALLAHAHRAIRDAVARPDGVGAARHEWMAKAHEAGLGARMRAFEPTGLLAGDIAVDNVSSYPLFDLRFGAKAPAAAASLRFVPCPRFVWVAPGSASGDLLLSVPLPEAQWARIAPRWRAAGLRLERDVPALHEFAAHPAGVRACLTEVTRSAIAGL